MHLCPTDGFPKWNLDEHAGLWYHGDVLFSICEKYCSVWKEIIEGERSCASVGYMCRCWYNKQCAWWHNMPRPRPLYARCGPPPVHSLHALRLRHTASLTPRIFMIDRQRLALGGGVETGLVDIHYVVTWTANQSSLVTLTFWPWKWYPSHVWRGLPLPILVFLFSN